MTRSSCVAALGTFLWGFWLRSQVGFTSQYEEYLSFLDMTTTSLSRPSTISHGRHRGRRLLTVREIKEQMVLPCNYVHDGFYLHESNEMLHQAYQSLMKMDPDDIPIMIECGGHDGITKSLSLKVSRCLHMNTLLIEASPKNYNILKQTRGQYDFTVHAALCKEPVGTVQMMELSGNSGQSKVVAKDDPRFPTVNCTTIDQELDRLAETYLSNDGNDNTDKRNKKLKLSLLVLDVEGHEPLAVQGIQKYRPDKVMMEIGHLNSNEKSQIDTWATMHNLKQRVGPCNDNPNDADECYNFDTIIANATNDDNNTLKHLFYGARQRHPPIHAMTSRGSKGYWFYGE